MKVSWTKGVDEKLKEELTLQFKASKVIRERLKVLINEKLELNAKDRVAKDGYDSPSWGYKQADSVGFERALREILSIID